MVEVGVLLVMEPVVVAQASDGFARQVALPTTDEFKRQKLHRESSQFLNKAGQLL
jgi:hypothetical protein